MNEAKHTPEPWEIGDEAGNDLALCKCGHPQFIHHDGFEADGERFVCDNGEFGDDCECRSFDRGEGFACGWEDAERETVCIAPAVAGEARCRSHAGKAVER